MTDERKKYLASISKEERIIRLELSIQKNRLRYLKELIKYPINTNDKRTMLRLMQDTRFIIKALKKQLPAPAEMEYGQEYICPICNTITQAPYKSLHEMFYCPYCGQKLR